MAKVAKLAQIGTGIKLLVWPHKTRDSLDSRIDTRRQTHTQTSVRRIRRSNSNPNPNALARLWRREFASQQVSYCCCCCRRLMFFERLSAQWPTFDSAPLSMARHANSLSLAPIPIGLQVRAKQCLWSHFCESHRICALYMHT